MLGPEIALLEWVPWASATFAPPGPIFIAKARDDPASKATFVPRTLNAAPDDQLWAPEVPVPIFSVCVYVPAFTALMPGSDIAATKSFASAWLAGNAAQDAAQTISANSANIHFIFVIFHASKFLKLVGIE
jgi:hypothetical protein